MNIFKLGRRNGKQMQEILDNKRVVVNCRFLSQPMTGVQRYAAEICKELKNIYSDILFITPPNVLHDSIASDLNAQIVGAHEGHMWEQWDLPRFLNHSGSPLLINLANTAPIFYKNKISTIHDVAFERFPESFTRSFRVAYKFAIPKIIRSSRSVITVSLFSKKEISLIYGTRPEAISIIPNAASDVFARSNAKTAESYILAVSSISAQKNFSGLIDAFSKLKQSSHKLYIVGSLNRSFSGTGIEQKINSDCRIKLLGRVTDEELVDLYSGATAFIYPSFYEGFGIPPLEAQACGCPVLVSRAASLPEVCGDSALYCDPYDTNDIADKISFLLSDPGLCETLRLRGYENAKRFSWEQSASRLLEIAKRLDG